MPLEAYLAFVAAATLLTITPGLDTALVVRTSAAEGARSALLAGAGIAAGCLAWGVLVAVGVGLLITASETAYDVVRFVGAGYLFYLGCTLVLRPRRQLAAEASGESPGRSSWFWRGLLTNLLNPKVGVFYVSFLPQFIPVGANATFQTVVLAALHALLGMVWFSALIAGASRVAKVLRRPRVLSALDRLTGGLFIAFGVRLALEAPG